MSEALSHEQSNEYELDGVTPTETSEEDSSGETLGNIDSLKTLIYLLENTGLEAVQTVLKPAQ